MNKKGIYELLLPLLPSLSLPFPFTSLFSFPFFFSLPSPFSLSIYFLLLSPSLPPPELHVNLRYPIHCPRSLHCQVRTAVSKGAWTKCSLVPTPRTPSGEKRSGERSQISWAYSPKRWKTNEIARSLIIT